MQRTPPIDWLLFMTFKLVSNTAGLPQRRNKDELRYVNLIWNRKITTSKYRSMWKLLGSIIKTSIIDHITVTFLFVNFFQFPALIICRIYELSTQKRNNQLQCSCLIIGKFHCTKIKFSIKEMWPNPQEADVKLDIFCAVFAQTLLILFVP